MKKLLLIFALLTVALTAGAQTKVIGTVTEAGTGEPIPFAGIYFKDTTVGLTADINGRFTLETLDPKAEILVCQLLGYKTQEKKVKHGAFSHVDFVLELSDTQLPGAFVKADNRRIKRLLANINANRYRNDPDARPSYKCDIYNKMELDLSHPKEYLDNKVINKQFGFIFDYMDTSAVSGVPYLPFMISESIVERRHTADPLIDNETITANHISGINPDANMLSQFTGSMHLRANFYRPFINTFNIEFPSPIQQSGLLFYNYYIIDSLQLDGRKTYLVRFHPKPNISSPAFDGEMHIDAEEFALKSIKAKMVKGGNVNWIRDIVLESDYQRLPDSTWFFSHDKLYADFSLALGDSSKVVSMIGTRQLHYENLDFSALEPLDPGDGKVKVLPEANNMDEAYWAEARPYDLTEKEKGIFNMVKQVQDVKLYKDVYKFIYTLVISHFDIGPIGLSIGQIVSSNSLQGIKGRIGIHTSKELSKTFRATGFVSYAPTAPKGWQFDGGLTYEHLFCKEPQRKLTLDGRFEAYQLGKGQSNLTSDNILTSFWGQQSKLTWMSNFSALYEHEFSMNFNLEAEMALKRFYASKFVQMDTWNNTSYPSVAINELRLMGRFSWEETVNRGFYTKTYLHTDYPVLFFTLDGSIPGLRPNDIGYFKPQFELLWKFRIPPLGVSQIDINAGTIVGKVPWMLLQMYPGNATPILDKTAFSCMEFFEFGSDTWATLFWYHCFNGFFLGKIPLINKLQLREEVSFKMAYGTLSDRNNGTDPKYGAMMRFPQWDNGEMMKTLNGVPYMEAGVGVSNIFRIFRVDFIWRLSHREVPMADGSMQPARRLFTVNVGAEMKF